MAGLKIPTRTERKLCEVRGVIRDIEVEDRPYRLLKDQFCERRGIRDDVKVPLTDYEILEHGGLERFFNDDGSRRDGSWPFDPDIQPKQKAARKKAKKKVAKKKSKK